MPAFTLFRKDDNDYITESINGKDVRVNVCLRRLVVKAAMLTDD